MSGLATGLMAAYLLCSYFVAYRFASLACRDKKSKGFIFRVGWYDRVASTYVLALPIYLVAVYLISKALV